MDEGIAPDTGDLYLAVEAEGGIGLRSSIAVGERLHRHQVAVVAQLDSGLGYPLAGPGDISGVGHVDEAARTPGSLDRRPQLGHQRVEALDEDQRLLAGTHVEAIQANGPQVVFPECGDGSTQGDDARLHRLTLS